MKMIWTVNKLLKLCKRDEPLLREWALSRLILLYPKEAANSALKLITDKIDNISREATRYFKKNGIKGYEDTLLDIYEDLTGEHAVRMSEVFLKQKSPSFLKIFNKKYSENNYRNDLDGYLDTIYIIAVICKGKSKKIVEKALERVIESGHFEDYSNTMFGAGIRAGLNIVNLFKLCINNPKQSILITNLLVEVCDFCGSWYSCSEIDELKKSQIIYNETNYIDELEGGTTGKKIRKLFKKNKYWAIIKTVFESTRNLIEKKKTEKEEVYCQWERGYGKPRQNIEAIINIKSIFNEVPEPERYKLVNCAIAVFSILLELSPLVGINLQDLNDFDALEVFLQNRDTVEEDAELEEILNKSEGKGEIADTCLEYLKKFPDSPANVRIISLLGDIGDNNILEELSGIDFKKDELFEEVLFAFRKRGNPVFSIISSMIDENDRQRTEFALNLLKDLLFDDAVDLILEKWDWLYQNHKEILLEAVRGIGDRKFISPLKNELKSGEFHEGEVYCLLSRVNGVKDPLVKKIENDIKRRHKRGEEMAQSLIDGDIEGVIDQPIDLKLQCRKCGRAYFYEISEIMIDAHTQEKFIFDTVECKNCGVVDHYKLTEMAIFTISSKMLATISLNEDKKAEDVKTGPIVFGETRPIDGKKMSLSQAESHYKNKIKKHPRNPEFLLGYANVLKMSKQTEDAIPIYNEILKIDPKAADAYLSLGQIAEKKGELNDAYEYFKKTVELIDEGNFRKIYQDMDEFKRELILNFLSLSEELNKPVPEHLLDTRQGDYGNIIRTNF